MLRESGGGTWGQHAARDMGQEIRSSRRHVYHTVEVEAVVEACVGEVDEVGGGDGHLIKVNFALDIPHSGLKGGDGIGHGCKAFGGVGR